MTTSEPWVSSMRTPLVNDGAVLLTSDAGSGECEIRRWILENDWLEPLNDVGVLVAFSGTVKDPDTDLEFTEPGANRDKSGKSISEAALPGAFDGDDFQLLLVANEYQIGFNQPLLRTMYVDKRLSGVQAIQTLSRLNRTAPSKTNTFVLDFVNHTEEIQRTFQPHYEATTVTDTADPQQLYELAHKLEEAQVFWKSEVEALCKVLFSPREKQTVHDQAERNRHLNPGVDRLKALEEKPREEFRHAHRAFVRLCAVLSQVMPFTDPDLEKLYTLVRFFETKLPQDPKKAPLRLDGDVALKYYRLDKSSEGSIVLRVMDPGVVYGASVGTKKAKDDEAQLSEIIEVLNERSGTEFNAADQILFDQFVAATKLDDEVVQRAKADPLDNFAIAMTGKG